MKRLEEVAIEYGAAMGENPMKPINASYDGFLAGVHYALKWIKVEDELPITGNRILFKENYGEEQIMLLTQKQEDIASVLKGFTYWRYLQIF